MSPLPSHPAPNGALGARLSPESSREQGGRAERPGAGREEGPGRGRQGDPAGGEAPTSPSWFLQQRQPLLTARRGGSGRLGDGDSEAERRTGQGAPASMDPGVRGRAGIS